MVNVDARPVVLAEPRITPVRAGAGPLRLVQVMEGLAHPWAIAFLPDGGWLISEREGRLWRVRGREVAEIRGLPPIRAGGQGGLMDLARERVTHQEVLLQRRIGRIRDVRVGPDRHLWILTDQRRGGLYRLEPLD